VTELLIAGSKIGIRLVMYQMCLFAFINKTDMTWTWTLSL